MKALNETTSKILDLTKILKNSFDYNEYKIITFSFIFLKRLDSLLKPTKKEVIKCYIKQNNISDKLLNSKSIDENGKELGFYNYCEYDLDFLTKNPINQKDNLLTYIDSFSENIKDILINFDLKTEILKLSEENLLNPLLEELSKIDLSPDNISNSKMGEIFEEIILYYSKKRGKSGESFTPKDINILMANLLLVETPNNKKIKIYDPTCGTGGTLTTCKDYILNLNKNFEVSLYGQELNPLTYALCKSNLLMRGESIENIKGPSSTLSDDLLKDEKFDYIVGNPPFGANWSNEKEKITEEAEKGFFGRFGAGLPRKNDSQLLFIQHMISKMKCENKTRIGVITTGSPLFTGDAGSGESKIRKWLFENDYIETLIELPANIYYDTSVNTYIWILTNKKSKNRKGNVQLIDARDIIPELTNKHLGKKYEITKKAMKKIIYYYKSFNNTDKSKILKNEDFGYSKITIERPMKKNRMIIDDKNNLTLLKYQQEIIERENKLKQYKSTENHDVFHSRKLSKILKNKADPNLRETQKIPLNENINEYYENTILKDYPDAWIDFDKTKTGYEVNFNQLTYDEKVFFNDIDYPISYLGNLVRLKKTKKIEENYDLFILPNVANSQYNKIIYYPHEISSEKENKLRNMIGCELKNNNILKEYLYCYLNSELGLKHVKYFKRTIIANSDDLSQVPIPIPDIETQSKIVETYRLMDSFFNDIELWKNNYLNNILNYESALESYKEFSCSINFGDDGGVKDFCRNWRIVYQGLAWPLAYTYLKATKGSKDESTMKRNYLILFEFIAAFNVVILISAINDSDITDDELKEISNKLWELYNNNEKTWHMMHFGSWTTLYSRLTKIFKNEEYEFITPLNREFFNELSKKKYGKLFNKLRFKERNPEAHGGLEDNIDVETKLEDLQVYMDTDIFDILNLYSGLKLYYTTDKIQKTSPTKITYEVMSLNGPCDPPNWHNLTINEELEPYSLYLYDSLSNSYLKLDDNLIRFNQIEGSKQYGIYIFDSVDTNKNIAKYKCYHHKNEFINITLNIEEDTYFKVSESFLKDVLRLK